MKNIKILWAVLFAMFLVVDVKADKDDVDNLPSTAHMVEEIIDSRNGGDGITGRDYFFDYYDNHDFVLEHTIENGISYVSIGAVDRSTNMVVAGQMFTPSGHYHNETAGDLFFGVPQTIWEFHNLNGTDISKLGQINSVRRGGKKYYNVTNAYKSLRHYGVVKQHCFQFCKPKEIDDNDL